MMKTIAEELGVEYEMVNGYRIPKLDPPPKPNIGKWGRMREKYLKEYRRNTYREMLYNNELKDHLEDVDRRAKDLYEKTLQAMMEQDGVTEQLKAEDQMLWVRKVNGLSHCAEEVVRNYVIYPEECRED